MNQRRSFAISCNQLGSISISIITHPSGVKKIGCPGNILNEVQLIRPEVTKRPKVTPKIYRVINKIRGKPI